MENQIMAGILDQQGMQEGPGPENTQQHEGGEAAPMEQEESAQESPRTQEIKDKIMSGAPPEMRSDIERIVVAGKRYMFDPKTHDLMIKQLQSMKGGNEADSLAQGIAALMSLIQGQSKGPFPLEAMMPAAVILLMEAIDFLAESGRLQPSDELIAESTKELVGYLMKKLKIGPEQIAQAKQAAQQGGQAQESEPMPTPAPQGGVVNGAMGA